MSGTRIEHDSVLGKHSLLGCLQMEAPAKETNLGHKRRWVLAAFALALLFFTKSEPLSWADASRLGTIQAIVEQHNLSLDQTSYLWQGDKVRIGSHFYSHQPPMMALLGSLPYGILHSFGRAIDDPGTYRILTLLLVGLPMLLGLAALGRIMRRFGATEGQAALLLLAAAFGTLAWPYSLVLNQHGLAAGLVMLAAEAVLYRRAALAGVLLALAATADLTAIFFAFAMVIPLVWSNEEDERHFDFGAAIMYGLAALPILALHFGINRAIAGDFWPLALHKEGFSYPLSPFVLMNLTGGGDTGPAGSALAYTRGALIGESGLFSLSPVLLFALFFTRRAWRQTPIARPLLLALLLGSIAIASFYLSTSRNFGGSAFGMRWFTVFAPLLLLIPAAANKGTSASWRAVFLPLLLWSASASALGAVQPWSKFHFRFEDSPLGMVAMPKEVRPSRSQFLKDEWKRIQNLEEVFTEARMDLLYQRLMDQHRKLYLRPLPEFSKDERQAWVRKGIMKLQHAVDLLDRANSIADSRAVGHFWLGKFHAALEERQAARREYEITLTLSPSYVWAKDALDKL